MFEVRIMTFSHYPNFKKKKMYRSHSPSQETTEGCASPKLTRKQKEEYI